MTDELSDEIENALNLRVNTTEQTRNMRKGLKQIIFETVSTLRNLFVKLKDYRDSKSVEISKLEEQVNTMKAQLEEYCSNKAKDCGTPSVIHTYEPAGTTARRLASTSSGEGNPTMESARTTAKTVAPSGSGESKLYSEVVDGVKRLKRFQLTVKTKSNQPPEAIKELLKTKINPIKIKVGINTFNSVSKGAVLIETNSKEETEKLEKEINTKREGELEANIHKMWKPRLVIFNIPEEISTKNLEDTLTAQNPDISLNKGDINAKFCYTTRKQNRNLVMEVGAQTRKLLIQKKIKLGWHICKFKDYEVATRCFKCSRFNHRHRDCRREETCPLCTGTIKLKDCSVDPRSYKCINCTIYNKHNPNKNIYTNHSSLDKKCPSLLAILEK